MNDPLIARFASACGATAPLDLRVDLVGGSVLAEGSIDQPFTLVGRDDACDVTLSDPEINPRHAWLQVLGGRVFVVDLGSRTGLLWPSGWRGPGWLDPGTPVGIGPFQLRLRIPASDRPSAYPAGYNPLTADAGDKTRPVVALEFRNGRRAKDRWQVNRLLTLVGRATDCKIHLTAEDISPYHCGIVSTPSGLWVVDLSGRGVVVNGERMRVAPLPQGSELWVGRFLIGCQYQTPSSSKGPGLVAARPTPVPVAPGDARLTTTPPPLASEDEVELGAAPEGGLPGSHIMADAFRMWSAPAGEPASHPIHVSGSGSKSPAATPLPEALADGPHVPDEGDDRSVVPLLRQMADVHDRSGDEFQQSLFLLARAFGRVKREHLVVLQHELSRIQELTTEINGLQLEVAQHVLTAAADRVRHPADGSPSDQDAAGPRSGGGLAPSAQTPLPDSPLATSPAAARAADRLATLQQDRSARWQALVAIFAGP